MIAIIGRGNVATHLQTALGEKHETVIVDPHSLHGMPPNPEVILICVSDDAIAEVAAKLPYSDTLVAHTSGSVPMDVLNSAGPNIGVFYPLQTFTKGVELDYSLIPVFIEASNESAKKFLKDLAASFTQEIHETDSETRKKLHLASVFACNFTNALYGISADILKDADLDFKVLLPLLNQTLKKVESLSPKEAQTGPAARGDIKIQQKHISMLEQKPEIQDIYASLNKYIMSQHSIPAPVSLHNSDELKIN